MYSNIQSTFAHELQLGRTTIALTVHYTFFAGNRYEDEYTDIRRVMWGNTNIVNELHDDDIEEMQTLARQECEEFFAA